MSTGVLYQLTGSRLAVHCAVSIWSLRQVYKGPVTLLATEDCWPIATLLASDDRLDLEIRQTELLAGCHRDNFVAKAWTYLKTPYDRTIYIDCDTTVIKPIDELFEYPFGVCQVAQINILDDHKVARRTRTHMRHWRELGPGGALLLQRAMDANVPCINNGMVVFDKEHPCVWEMHHLALAGRLHNLGGDQLALQLMLAHHPEIAILPDKWNRCLGYSTDANSAAILHFHGRRWYVHRRCRRLWYEYLMTTLRANVGSLSKWVNRYNYRVAELVKYGRDAKPQEEKTK
jgi:hypothetical protein